MPAVALTESPVLKAVEAILDATDGSKFTLRLTTRAYVGSTPVEITFDVPSLAMNTWDGTWWAANYEDAVADAYLEWNYSLPA